MLSSVVGDDQRARGRRREHVGVHAARRRVADVSTCRSALRCCVTRTTSPMTFWNIVGGRFGAEYLLDVQSRPATAPRRAAALAWSRGDRWHGAALGPLLGALARGLGLGPLQVALERPLADAGEVADQLEELVLLASVDLGGQDDLDVELGGFLACLLDEPPARWRPSAAAGMIRPPWAKLLTTIVPSSLTNSLALPGPYSIPSIGSASVSPSYRAGIGHHVVDGDDPQLVVVELERPCRPRECAWPAPP